MPHKNPHAVALGRLGGQAGTPKQNAARKANAQHAGRPRDPLPSPIALYQRRRRARLKRQGGR